MISPEDKDRPKAPISYLDVFRSIDMFQTNAELTLNGKRSIQSVCGGMICLVLTALVIMVVANFVGIYLNNSDKMISYERKIESVSN